jgi:hypothetical protein
MFALKNDKISRIYENKNNRSRWRKENIVAVFMRYKMIKCVAIVELLTLKIMQCFLNVSWRKFL